MIKYFSWHAAQGTRDGTRQAGHQCRGPPVRPSATVNPDPSELTASRVCALDTSPRSQPTVGHYGTCRRHAHHSSSRAAAPQSEACPNISYFILHMFH